MTGPPSRPGSRCGNAACLVGAFRVDAVPFLHSDHFGIVAGPLVLYGGTVGVSGICQCDVRFG